MQVVLEGGEEGEEGEGEEEWGQEMTTMKQVLQEVQIRQGGQQRGANKQLLEGWLLCWVSILDM
jgi:hypothetical protein